MRIEPVLSNRAEQTSFFLYPYFFLSPSPLFLRLHTSLFSPSFFFSFSPISLLHGVAIAVAAPCPPSSAWRWLRLLPSSTWLRWRLLLPAWPPPRCGNGCCLSHPRHGGGGCCSPPRCGGSSCSPSPTCSQRSFFGVAAVWFVNILWEV